MVHRTLNQTINFDGTIIQLSQLQPHSLQKELEFLFDHAPFELQSLLNVIPRDKESKSIPSTQLQGFMKGFIDLSFIHDGKIYLLDYKSNHLGDRYKDYSSDAIEKDLLKHGYDIQYHIYAYAAHRIMQNRILDYDYNMHFGGVCYLYLRGLQEDGDTGVFTTTQPDHKTIQQLDTVFGRFQDA
jgi:exodeoxyribonuclease V beta subunit